MESQKLWCEYDSTWEDEEEEEPPEPQERQRSRWIVSHIPGSFLWAWLYKVVIWISQRWFIFTGRMKEGKNGSDKKHYQHENEGAVRLRNVRAAQDMQIYRHDYPDLDDEDLHETPNLDFYMNKERFQPNGIKIEELLQEWNNDYQILEQSHSYIQWLFPLREFGMNWHAQPLSRKELQAFRQSEEVKNRFVRAYKLMLDFYGIELVNSKTGKLKRASHYKERFQNLNWHSHNNLRITRILKCLGEMGYERYQEKLVKFFLKETLVEGTLSNVKQSALDYFLFTIRNRQSRKRLVHYAWQCYKPQDRFAWGPIEKLKRFKAPKSDKQHSISSTAEGDEEANTGGESARPANSLGPTTIVCINETVGIQASADAVQIKGEPREDDTKSDAGPAVEDLQAAQTPEELAVKNVSEGEAINHDDELQPGDGSFEAPKEVRKRKLPVTEQEEPAKTLQLGNMKSNNGSVNEDFGEECTESSAAGTVLPALKKKKEDAKEPVNVNFEQETKLGKGSIPVPTMKEENEKMLPMGPNAECAKETIQAAGNVEGKGLSNLAIINICAPIKTLSVKDDLASKESEKAAINEEGIEKQDTENTDRNAQITEGDVKTSVEGVEQHEDFYGRSKAQVEENGVTSLSLSPLGKTQDPELGVVFGAKAEKSKEEGVGIACFLETAPKTPSVCHSVPSRNLTNPENDNTLYAEESRDLGRKENCTQNEQKPVSDVKSTQPDYNEHIEAPKEESGGQPRHDLNLKKERKFLYSASEVGENNGTVGQQERISTQSANGLDVNNTLTEQVDCRLAAKTANGAEGLHSLNKLQNCQAGSAAYEVKEPDCSTEQECKATLAASEVVDKPTLMQLVDQPVQAADEANESKAMAHHHHRSVRTHVAKEVEDCSGNVEQQDLKCEQTADESLKPGGAGEPKA